MTVLLTPGLPDWAIQQLENLAHVSVLVGFWDGEWFNPYGQPRFKPGPVHRLL